MVRFANTKTLHRIVICICWVAVIGCGAKKNRLAEASSPYLQQHADNPVDWFEWGDEALQKAKSENKPLLVSIGYASCHWCHKMEEECFMDVEVAEMMNENFVCIKVDREERPDIDEIYMNACQMISGTAGWPLNAFALPDGKPFFAGTYYSRQSWLNLLEKIASAYRTQHSKVVLQANALTNGIVKLEIPLDTFSEQPKISEMLYKNFFDSLFHRIDLTNGGFTGTPKFPLPGAVEFLLQYGFITKNQNAVHAAEQWLTKMALGGIYDQVGGGFARYAVDKYWRTPHFEKMLYDNGQLLSAYSHAFQLSGNPFFKEIAEETAAFALNNLRAENGAFYSSLNAVTPDGEGVYYAWSHKEFQKVAGSSAASLSRYYHVTPEGNWKNGLNILYATTTPTEFSQQLGRDSVKFWDVLRSSKARLLSHRDQRKKPEVDTKIITSWNALMITGLLDAFAALQQQEYLDGALAAARFIEKKMLGQDGLLMRTYNEGKDTIPGFLEDYAQLAKAYIRLYQITFDKHWLLLANKLAKTTLDKFFDRRTGMFYTTPQDAKLVVVRKMSLVDDAMPSDNATMAHVLHHLGLYFDNEEYLEKSAQMMSTVTAQMSADPRHYPQWGLVAGLYVYGAFEIAICGREAISRNHQMQKHYLPLNLYLGSTDQENLFLLQGKLVPDQTLIYACVNRVCKRPVETVQEALQQLEDARASRISAVTRTTK